MDGPVRLMSQWRWVAVQMLLSPNVVPATPGTMSCSGPGRSVQSCGSVSSSTVSCFQEKNEEGKMEGERANTQEEKVMNTNIHEDAQAWTY